MHTANHKKMISQTTTIVTYSLNLMDGFAIGKSRGERERVEKTEKNTRISRLHNLQPFFFFQYFFLFVLGSYNSWSKTNYLQSVI